MPQIMPPINWLVAVTGLRMVPAAKAPTARGTADLAGAPVDADLGELGPEGISEVGLQVRAARRGHLALVELGDAVRRRPLGHVLGIDLESARWRCGPWRWRGARAAAGRERRAGEPAVGAVKGPRRHGRLGEPRGCPRRPWRHMVWRRRCWSRRPRPAADRCRRSRRSLLSMGRPRRSAATWAITV